MLSGPPESTRTHAHARRGRSIKQLIFGLGCATILGMNQEEPEPSEPPISARDGRQLITKAFEIARMSGRADWTEMTTAVLKNRLLDLTERAFKESDYGVRNISEFVTSFPDLIALDKSTSPPKVVLIKTTLIKGQETPATRGKIRADLWRAIIDYRSGNSYYWDGVQAVPINQEFAEMQGRFPKLPTIPREKMDTWRREFRESLSQLVPLNDQDIEQLEIWARQALPTTELPLQTRGLWNDDLNRRVADRLAGWFEEHSLPLPDNMVQRRLPGRETAPVAVAQLRELILRCVRTMTEAELRSMALPPAAVLRAFGGGQSGLRAGYGRQGEV